MNVIIATDDPDTCKNQSRLLDQQTDITAYACIDARSLQHTVRTVWPDMVLLDWERTGRPPAALLFALDRASQRPAGNRPDGHWPTVIVLSDRREVKPMALACGAAAFVHKHEASTILSGTMQRLLAAHRETLAGKQAQI